MREMDTTKYEANKKWNGSLYLAGSKARFRLAVVLSTCPQTRGPDNR